MSNLTELIARLEACELAPHAVGFCKPHTLDLLAGHLGGNIAEAYKLVTSVDATIALLQERLPDNSHALQTTLSGSYGWTWREGLRSETETLGKAKTAPCALLIAALKAMEPS